MAPIVTKRDQGVEDQVMARLIAHLDQHAGEITNAQDQQQYLQDLAEKYQLQYKIKNYEEDYPHTGETLSGMIKKLIGRNLNKDNRKVDCNATRDDPINRLFIDGAKVLSAKYVERARDVKLKVTPPPVAQASGEDDGSNNSSAGKTLGERSSSDAEAGKRKKKAAKGGRRQGDTKAPELPDPPMRPRSPAQRAATQVDPQRPAEKKRRNTKRKAPDQEPESLDPAIARDEDDVGAHSRQKKRAAPSEQEERPAKGTKRQKTVAEAPEADQPKHTDKALQSTKPRQKSKRTDTAKELASARKTSHRQTSQQPSGNPASNVDFEDALRHSTPKPQSGAQQKTNNDANNAAEEADESDVHDEDNLEPGCHEGDNTRAPWAKDDSRTPEVLNESLYDFFFDRADPWLYSEAVDRINVNVEEAVSIIFPTRKAARKWSSIVTDPSPQLEAVYKTALGSQWLKAAGKLKIAGLLESGDFFHCLIWSYLVNEILQSKSTPWPSPHELRDPASVGKKWLAEVLYPGDITEFDKVCGLATQRMLTNAGFREEELLPAADVAAPKMLLKLSEHIQQLGLPRLPSQKLIDQFRLICENALFLLGMLQIPRNKLEVLWYDSTDVFDGNFMEYIGKVEGKRIAFTLSPGVLNGEVECEIEALVVLIPDESQSPEMRDEDDEVDDGVNDR